MVRDVFASVSSAAPIDNSKPLLSALRCENNMHCLEAAYLQFLRSPAGLSFGRKAGWGALPAPQRGLVIWVASRCLPSTQEPCSDAAADVTVVNRVEVIGPQNLRHHLPRSIQLFF